MNIGILAVDSNFPNLALMKISAYHKARGDQVEWYNPLCKYDKVYAAKVFTFTPDYNYYINANQIEKVVLDMILKKFFQLRLIVFNLITRSTILTPICPMDF